MQVVHLGVKVGVEIRAGTGLDPDVILVAGISPSWN